MKRIATKQKPVLHLQPTGQVVTESQVSGRQTQWTVGKVEHDEGARTVAVTYVYEVPGPDGPVAQNTQPVVYGEREQVQVPV